MLKEFSTFRILIQAGLNSPKGTRHRRLNACAPMWNNPRRGKRWKLNNEGVRGFLVDMCVSIMIHLITKDVEENVWVKVTLESRVYGVFT